MAPKIIYTRFRIILEYTYYYMYCILLLLYCIPVFCTSEDMRYLLQELRKKCLLEIELKGGASYRAVMFIIQAFYQRITRHKTAVKDVQTD